MTELYFSGKKYISLKSASLVSGYAKDYIGQLCRGNKIKCKRVSNVWFVDAEDLILHQKKSKEEKTGLAKKNFGPDEKLKYFFTKTAGEKKVVKGVLDKNLVWAFRNFFYFACGVTIVFALVGSRGDFSSAVAAREFWGTNLFTPVANLTLKVSNEFFFETQKIRKYVGQNFAAGIISVRNNGLFFKEIVPKNIFSSEIFKIHGDASELKETAGSFFVVQKRRVNLMTPIYFAGVILVCLNAISLFFKRKSFNGKKMRLNVSENI